jgi:hypothetical protein
MSSKDDTRSQGRIAPAHRSAGRGPHNQKWLVEDVFPLGGVEVAWSDELREFNYELLDLGLQVAHPVDEHPRWRGQRVMTRGAAVLIYGGESLIEGMSGRSIVLDPKRPKHIVSETNDKLFGYDIYGRYRLSEVGVELERVLLSIEDLRLIVFSMLEPFLPHGGVPGSLPAWAWLRELADQTGAAVVAMIDGPEQLKRMWCKGIRPAAERRLPQEGAR